MLFEIGVITKCIDITILKKTSRCYELQFTKNGKKEDITGWTVYFTVKALMSDTDANAVIKKVVTDHIDPENGKTLIQLTPTDTDLLGNFYYSIDFKDTDDNQGVLVSGRIRFKDTVLDQR